MSVKVEKTENKNEVKLQFTVEAAKFDEAMKKVFNKNAKYFNIPGFRKGKAPMMMVEKFYGSEIFYEDAFNEVVPEIYDEAIKSEKLDVVSHPDINIEQIGKGKDLIFTAIVQTKPEVKLGKYKGRYTACRIYGSDQGRQSRICRGSFIRYTDDAKGTAPRTDHEEFRDEHSRFGNPWQDDYHIDADVSPS